MFRFCRRHNKTISLWRYSTLNNFRHVSSPALIIVNKVGALPVFAGKTFALEHVTSISHVTKNLKSAMFCWNYSPSSKPSIVNLFIITCTVSALIVVCWSKFPEHVVDPVHHFATNRKCVWRSVIETDAWRQGRLRSYEGRCRLLTGGNTCSP